MENYKKLTGLKSVSIIGCKMRRRSGLMKRILGIILVVFAIALTACGKGEDMSGTYYFERTTFVPGKIGQLTLVKASEDGTKYNAFEAIPAHQPESQGEMILNDGSYLDITMSISSNEMYEFDAGIDLSNLRGVKYEFNKGVLTLDDQFFFYRDDTEKGKELRELWNEGQMIDSEDVWQDEEAWENEISDNEDTYTSAAEEYYANS